MAVGVGVAAAQMLGLFLVPESPAWTAAVKGDVARAKRTLQRIRGPSVPLDQEVRAWGAGGGAGDAADDAAAGEQVASEEEGLLSSSPSSSAAGRAPGVTPVRSKTGGGNDHLGFFQVVCDPLYRPAILAVVGIMFAQQLCGINSIVMYSVSLLADLLPMSSALLTILISLINLFTTIACSPLPDRLGRKTCLLLSIVGQGSSALALALSIVFGVKILSAVSVLFFTAFFAVGLGPVPFIMASELVGQEAVGATQSWCLAANYTATFLVAQFFPIVNAALNQRLGGAGWVYFIFAAFALLWTAFVAWNVPETKGKRDADEVWGRTRRLD
ncbi:hypothetical protein VTK73DRAFT_5851 [Phialemonium thermophilum]|uniref:Major facilitator superfamily (MFS) profile domain-containing protein n=1 Tax=Phialemonium thermophilum TaxID=223376 RepID=A0ABR3V0E1_9PEZI